MKLELEAFGGCCGAVCIEHLTMVSVAERATRVAMLEHGDALCVDWRSMKAATRHDCRGATLSDPPRHIPVVRRLC